MKYAIVSNPRDRLSAGPCDAGSIAIVSLNLVRRLAAEHEVLITCARGDGQAQRERIAPGVDVLRMTQGAKLHKYRELAGTAFNSVPPYFLWDRYYHDYYEQAAIALGRERPDVIHIQNYSQSAHLFRRHSPDARIVVHLHDTALARVDEKFARKVLTEADLVVTCSRHVAHSIVTAHPWIKVPVVPIYNGVELADFDSRHASAGTEGEVRIAYVGRLSPEKGVHVLIDAFNQVIARAPQARLVLLGSASMFSYAVVKLFRSDPHWAAILPFYGSHVLQRMFRHLHRSGKRYVDTLKRLASPAAANATQFQGDLPHDRVANELGRAHIVVVPSVCDEPFGIPAIEGMAAGLPVVATAAGGLCEIVQPGRTGLLVPRSDASALAAALIELVADASRRETMGRAGRAAAERFTWDQVVRNLLAALESAGILPRPTAAGRTAAHS
jgi:glycosyltransferase involved in cell wall biosynthesis